MYAVHATGTLRVSREGELYGLDLHEHGINAYPEYVISAIGATSGGSHLAEEKAPVAAAAPARMALEAK
jgi:Amt family ammonium transporter